MAFVLNDRVRETTSTNGTSNFSLAGAATGGYVTFLSACSNGDTFHYCAQNTSASEWEVGLGTYTTSGNILTRPGSVLANSAGTTAKISFTNNPVVFMTIAGTTNLERVMNPSNLVLLAANNFSDVASTVTALNTILPSQGSNSGKFLTTNGTNPSWATPLSGTTSALEFLIDGGGSVVTTGKKPAIEVPFACTIVACRVHAPNESGSFSATIKKGAYNSSKTSIVASAPAALSSSQWSQDTTLTGWTTSISAGDWLEPTVDSATTVTMVTVALTITR